VYCFARINSRRHVVFDACQPFNSRMNLAVSTFDYEIDTVILFRPECKPEAARETSRIRVRRIVYSHSLRGCVKHKVIGRSCRITKLFPEICNY